MGLDDGCTHNMRLLWDELTKKLGPDEENWPKEVYAPAWEIAATPNKNRILGFEDFRDPIRAGFKKVNKRNDLFSGKNSTAEVKHLKAQVTGLQEQLNMVMACLNANGMTVPDPSAQKSGNNEDKDEDEDEDEVDRGDEQYNRDLAYGFEDDMMENMEDDTAARLGSNWQNEIGAYAN